MTISQVCESFSRRIGNEVGWVDNVAKAGATSIQASATPAGVIPLLSLNTQALLAIRKMQICYLDDLFEAFMQAFIAAKDSITESEMAQNGFWRNYLKAEITQWNVFCTHNKPINESSSFMNIRYSLFILEVKYGIKFPTYLTPMILELGSLRNCLVHNDGKLQIHDSGCNGYFSDTLSETLSYLRIDASNADEILIPIESDFVYKVTFDLQTFVDLCGERISRPIDHNNFLENQGGKSE